MSNTGKKAEADRERGQPPPVQSVARAARALKILLYSGSRLNQAQIAAEMGLHKTTVMRLLHTLEAEGLIRRDEVAGSYELAVDFWLALAARNPEAVAAPRAVQAVLDGLAQAIGETIMLLVADVPRRAMVTAMWSEGASAVHIDPRHIGPVPMHAMSSGKCYLAGLTDEELRHWLTAGLPPVTKHTITSPRRLLEELRRVRERGYATSHQEGVQRLSGMAVPVESAGRTRGGLQVFTLAENLTDRNLQRWVPLLREAAARLSPLLGLASSHPTASDDRGGPAGASVSSEMPDETEGGAEEHSAA